MNEQETQKYNAYLKNIGFEDSHIADLRHHVDYKDKTHRSLKVCLYILVYGLIFYAFVAFQDSFEVFMMNNYYFKFSIREPERSFSRLYIGLVILIPFFPLWYGIFYLVFCKKSHILETAYEFHKKAMNAATGKPLIFSNKAFGQELIDDNFKSLPFHEAYSYIYENKTKYQVDILDYIVGIPFGFCVFLIMMFNLISGLFP